MMLESIFLDPFRFEFMQRGLASALFLSVSGGLLGSILVLRRLALMGDALAHSLLPGIGLAYLFFGPSPLGLFAGALVAGLLTSLGSAFVSLLTRIKEEAAFAASGTCVVSHGAQHAWIGTGGKSTRVLRSVDGGASWTASAAPMLSGKNTTGIYSVAFRDAQHGVVVGGDYTTPEAAEFR